ncbi:MAG: hypothetical protein HOY79_33795 [Streptomyces sp.]|nr:hypothetical protein [Streptomyces sp.]NUS11334.1 hypothetical protein [Streptomyces sp.]NUS23391.1 hypothetical protein [Streptomyces sp.]
MEITTLAALMAAGTIHTFHARYGVDADGVRGAVVQIGSPLNRDLVLICDTETRLHEYNRHLLRVA